jgi:hypothetical protein
MTKLGHFDAGSPSFPRSPRKGWETTNLDPPDYYRFRSLTNPSRRNITALTRFADHYDPPA